MQAAAGIKQQLLCTAAPPNVHIAARERRVQQHDHCCLDICIMRARLVIETAASSLKSMRRQLSTAHRTSDV